MTSSTTLRLPDGLKGDAETYAASLGISLNALCSVALRDYLDARRPDLSSVPPAPVVRATPADSGRKCPAAGILAAVYVQPVGGVNSPCPCGSGQKWKRCHGKPGT